MNWIDAHLQRYLWMAIMRTFDDLNSFPVTMWHGGKVHKVGNSVIHLMRGQVFRIAEKTFFTFGGAASHDIQGGIFEVKDADKCWLNHKFCGIKDF